MAAVLVLSLHLAIVVFNVAGCILVPVGAWRRWRWVRWFWWRLAHLVSLAVVALQALLGRACFLTVWQDELVGDATHQPLIAGWINHLVYWPLPLWVFAVLYVTVFAYVIVLWMVVPPRRA